MMETLIDLLQTSLPSTESQATLHHESGRPAPGVLPPLHQKSGLPCTRSPEVIHTLEAVIILLLAALRDGPRRHLLQDYHQHKESSTHCTRSPDTPAP